MKSGTGWFVVVRGVAVILAGGLAWGQQPAATGEPGPAPAAEQSEPDHPLREQSIYIPYENLRKTFEKQGRGVFLPYEKFRQLWDAARAAEAGAGEGERRRTALITEIDSEASVRNDVVEVRDVEDRNDREGLARDTRAAGGCRHHRG